MGEGSTATTETLRGAHFAGPASGGLEEAAFTASFPLASRDCCERSGGNSGRLPGLESRPFLFSKLPIKHQRSFSLSEEIGEELELHRSHR